VLADLAGTVPWRPRPLPAVGGAARVALVQTTAMLLRGDDVRLDIDVGPGAHLEVVELGGTIAHHVRAGVPARLTIGVRVGRGATLRWPAQPLVLAAGARLVRTCEITIDAGAVALLRETIVLGRSGESSGALDAHTRVEQAGRPLLDERLDTGDPSLLRSPVVAGPARVLDTVMLLGARPADGEGAFDLAGPGALWRACDGDAAQVDAVASTVYARWATAVTPPARDASAAAERPAAPARRAG
jgi:urease accessory protein